MRLPICLHAAYTPPTHRIILCLNATYTPPYFTPTATPYTPPTRLHVAYFSFRPPRIDYSRWTANLRLWTWNPCLMNYAAEPLANPRLVGVARYHVSFVLSCAAVPGVPRGQIVYFLLLFHLCVPTNIPV